MDFDNLLITGKMNELERQIKYVQQELEPINKRLEIAYEYKDNLYNALRQADDGIKKIQNEYFEHINQIKCLLDKMQKELKIYVSDTLG